MYRAKLKIIFGVLCFLVAGFLSVGLVQVHAQDTTYQPPAACPDNFTIDVGCQLKKISNPQDGCQLLICKDSSGTATGSDNPVEYQKLIGFFGKNALYVKSTEKIPALVNLAITTFLGVVSVFALVYGFYIGAFVRAKTTDDAKIAEANKTLINIIVGFVLAWGFIFIMQFVSGILGLGSLNDLVVLENNPGEQAPGIIIK